MKICTRCKRDDVKFNKDSTVSDGLSRWCVNCNKEYREENKDSISKYREENKDNIRKLNKKYRGTDKDIKQRKEWSKNNPNYMKENYKQKCKLIDEEKIKNGNNGTDILFYKIIFTHKVLGFRFIKVGITKRNIKERYKWDGRDYDLEILEESYYDKEYAKAVERSYKFDENRVKFNFPEGETFNGYTECFIDQLPDLTVL